MHCSWSKSGALLASGSDDQHLNIHRYQPENTTSQFALTTTVATGHSQNIFSVKFMPHHNDRTLITAAGDGEVRIFDVEYGGAATTPSTSASIAGARRRMNLYNGARFLTDGDTNCRVYRSHGDRVKRIVTESSPHLFLTCSEDGEVRQWDLRQPSSAYPPPGRRYGSENINVPPPLISYKKYLMDLNTISCSASQPHYIALGGAHLHCFLHDRRMLGRDTICERGGTPASTSGMSETEEELMGQATQCVKKFAPNGQQRMRRTDNGHITACKISDANPNELIASWSGDHIYSFDIMRSPDASELAELNRRQSTVSSGKARRAKESSERKRKRRMGSQPSVSVSGERAGSRQRTTEPTEEENGTEMALRVQYGNGQSEDIPINAGERSQSPNSQLRESVLPSQQREVYRMARDVVKLRKAMFTLGDPRQTSTDNIGHSSSFTSVLGYAASILPKMAHVIRTWRYPVDTNNLEVATHKQLRVERESAYRFVQASGVVARALGGRLQTGGDPIAALEPFSTVNVPSNHSQDITRQEQFGYDFIKAIFLWLDSGIGALLEGFATPSRGSKRFPVPRDASVEALDEVLIPYLLNLASTTPVINVDSSRFEVDENRVLYTSEQAAVLAFAAALKTPFADLSSPVAHSSNPLTAGGPERLNVQDRQAAQHHWGLRVARGVLMNAGEGVNFALVNRAFGGLGRPDAETTQEERTLSERHEFIDPEEEEQTLDWEEAAQFLEDEVQREGSVASQSDISGFAEEDMIALSDLHAAAEEDEDDEVEEETDEDDVPPLLRTDRVDVTGDSDAGDEEENEGEDDEDDDLDVDVDEELDDEDDEEDDSDSDSPPPGYPRFMYTSAFQRRQHREKVEAHVPCAPHTRVYRGHCNVKTVKDVNYFGLDDQYVVSGSDDGNLFIWDRKTTKLVNILEGDGEVVNVLQGHPYETMLAVSGIDHTIKIFSPDARRREDARLGRGVGEVDSSSFSSIQWPARMRGRVPRHRPQSTSEPAVPAPAPDEDDDEYVASNGLESKKRMGDEYQIVSKNDLDRQGGNQEAFITVSDLVSLLFGR